jgi:hypothetical protein
MNSKEIYKQEPAFLETSPDEILNKIREKINLDNLEEWQVGEILGLLKKEKINQAIGKMSEIFDLEEKELEHLRKLPAEVVLKIFVKEEVKEE